MAIKFGKHKAVLRRKELLHDALGIFEFETDPGFTFEPGQFVTFDWDVAGKTIKRSYSVASAPHECPRLGFYVRRVLKGTFTPSLFELPEGTELAMAGPLGHFVLDDSTKVALLLASGTGLGPYISMVRDLLKRDTDREVIVVHGASYEKDLGYREELERMEQSTRGKRRGFRLRYIPTLSRAQEEPQWTGETGRVEQFLEKGRVEAVTGKTVTPEKMVVYACGHPDMIDHAVVFFEGRGFTKVKDIKFEKYW